MAFRPGHNPVFFIGGVFCKKEYSITGDLLQCSAKWLASLDATSLGLNIPEPLDPCHN